MDPQMRIGDAEREQVVTALQEYLTEGYLSLDEFSERSAAAYRAKTRGELAVLTDDLAPRTDLAPSRGEEAPAISRRSWTPAVIAVVVLVGLVVVAVGVTMLVMMMGVMGMMG